MGKEFQQMAEVPTLIEAYRSDPMIRERLNEKGIYINFGEEVTLTMYLTKHIEDSDYYQEFSEVCATLQPDDNIVLMIDSPGGYLSGAQMISRVMNNCPAYSIAIVIDMAASAATIIALQCDELRMEPFSHFMLHSVSFGSGGKLNEVQAHTEFSIKQSKHYLETVYKDFLTPEEIVDVIRGADIYFTADETMERFNNIQERRLAQHITNEQENTKAYIAGLQRKLVELEASIIPEDKPKVKPKPKPKV